MASRLTIKQEKYVQGLIEGLSQREAYRRAYPNTKMKDKTIDEEASKMLKNPKISQRYEELISEHKAKALWTREEAVETLRWLKKKAEDDIEAQGFRQANSTALVNAVKELNAMEGMYHSDKIQAAKLEIERAKAEKGTDTENEVADILRGLVNGTDS